MDKLGFSVEAGVKTAQRGCFSRLLSSATGSGAIDYLMIVGGCSLAGVVGFKNFGDALDKDLNREAQLILGKETPISGQPQVPGQVTAVTAPGGLKPLLDGFVPPGTVFPSCGVNGCTTCSQLGGESVARVSLALSSEEGSARSNGPVQPGGTACSAASAEPVAVPSSELECNKPTSPCNLREWLDLGEQQPGLRNCEIEPTRDAQPPYHFSVTDKSVGDGKCNVTKLRVGVEGEVTFCFKELKLNDANKLDVAKKCLAAASQSNSYCTGQDEMEATYHPLWLNGVQKTSQVDLSRYAVSPPVDPCSLPESADSVCTPDTMGEAANQYTVQIPVSVTGAVENDFRARSNRDDRADFRWARWALAIKLLQLEDVEEPTREQIAEIAQKASCIEKFQKSGFTWDHGSIKKGNDGKYYYEMMLVPTAIHATAPHEGGSSWARKTVDKGENQRANEIWSREKIPKLPAWEDQVLTPRYPNGDNPPPPECLCE